MDKISIKDLEVFCHHGVFPEETTLGQKFILSVVFYLDTSKAGKSDDLTKSIHYGEAAQYMKAYMKKNTFKLLESVVEHLAEELLICYPIADKVELELKKPWAPILLSLDTVSVMIERRWHICHIAIGSNLGDKEANLNKAIELLHGDERTQVIKVSDFIVTAPYGGVPQEDFVNGALEIKTLRTPRELLELIGEIEEKLKRVREIHWGPRTIDLDIIFYDDMVIVEDDLIIPHKEMTKRDFVLKPLCQIAPAKIHPLMGETVAKLFSNLPVQEA